MKPAARLLGLAAIVLAGGCATAPGGQQIAASRSVFMSGNVGGALVAYEDAYRNQRTKDTPYYLEKGYLTRLVSPDHLGDSSLNLREADKVVQNWEERATLDLGRTTAEFASFLFAPISSGAAYEPKDFEKSLLSYSLAVNHMLAGRGDLAAIEARKLAEREKLIESLHEKKAVALREKEHGESRSGGEGARSFSSIDRIQGYPVQVFESPAVNALRNAYQSAAAHYLAGFVFESNGEPGLAAPGYRLALELRPESTLFRRSLEELDAKTANRLAGGSEKADTLVIVETGLVPQLVSHSTTYPFPTVKGPKLVTFRLPVIGPARRGFEPASITVEGTPLELFRAVDIDAMARRQLRDEMPGHVLKATTQAVAQVVAQIAAEKAVEERRRKNQDPTAAILASLLVGVAMSAGDVDVRAWSTLPSAILLGRASFDKGRRTLAIPTPQGVVTRTVELERDYELIHVRLTDSGAIVSTRPSEPARAAYMTVPRPLAGAQGSALSSLLPAAFTAPASAPPAQPESPAAAAR